MPPVPQAPPQQAPVIMAQPFTASSHEHTEPAATVTVTPTAAVQQLDPIDVPASGYLRALWIEVTGAGGAGGTIAADGPWNLIQSLQLQEVNGATIVSPIDGYALYVANVIGGYSFNNDPALAPFHVGSSPNPSFALRVPVEVSRDGLGALANQNAAAQFKLSLAINTIAAAFSAAPSPVPTLTIKVFLEAWTLPAAQDNRGRPQAQVPPLLGTGQYWSSRTQSILVGENTITVRRVGNYIRALVFIARDASGVRVDTSFPSPVQMVWDGNMIHNASQKYFTNYLREKIGGAFTRPTGVFAFPFNHPDGRMGNDTPDLWLPTTESTRLEVYGVCAAAGSVQTLVNEVAPVEVNQAQRYETPNESGGVTYQAA